MGLEEQINEWMNEMQWIIIIVNDTNSWFHESPFSSCEFQMALIDFTLSNARRFYSSMGNPLGGKGLNLKFKWLLLLIISNISVNEIKMWLHCVVPPMNSVALHCELVSTLHI